MTIKQAKENILKNLYAECEKLSNRPRRPGKKTTTIFNVGKFVSNAIDEIEKLVREECVKDCRKLVAELEKEAVL